jgi:DNA polymerase V
MSRRLFVLIDVNNFYASCEEVFDPWLRGKALCVLSNNDGCIVARSREAKALGVAMGEPWHLVRKRVPELIYRSSNYELYEDLSARVMRIAAQFAQHLECYSIDECFLELEPIRHEDLAGELLGLKQRIRTWTGLPVSIGVGGTKTLAKLANDLAKPTPAGIFDWESLHADARERRLQEIKAGAVWGVGARLARQLAEIGVHSASELARAELARLRGHFSVTLARTAAELRGIACLPLVEDAPIRQQVMVSRSFGREITSYEALRESVLTYLARAAEKLRAEGLAAQQLQLFVSSNVFREDHEQYLGGRAVALPVPSNDTLELASAAVAALRACYREGIRYKKAGILLRGLVTTPLKQGSILDNQHKRSTRDRLNCAVDALNRRYGRDTVRLAGSGIDREWRMRRTNVSPRYTTRWDEIAIAHAR